jgi:dolichol-phosphate mannosyltransferase
MNPFLLPVVSVIIPVRNEAGNIGPLVLEIEQALANGPDFELIYVNDGSADGTADELRSLMVQKPYMRRLDHAHSCGQSAAVRSGVQVARGRLIVTLDGDGQNDPAFIPEMIAAMEAAGPNCGLVQGQRVGRQGSGFKRLQSLVANKIRGRILRDGTRDTGCGLKCFRRDVYLALPYFDALHRFMPALVRREGYEVVFVDIRDRQRLSGVSNYGFFDRLWVGVLDLLGVWWLIKRRKKTPRTTEHVLETV